MVLSAVRVVFHRVGKVKFLVSYDPSICYGSKLHDYLYGLDIILAAS